MTAKEKAIELFEKYYCLLIVSRFEVAKQQALIAVNEIIVELDSERVFERIYFWNEVKEEINKL